MAATLFGESAQGRRRWPTGPPPVPPEAWGHRGAAATRSTRAGRKVVTDGWDDDVTQESLFYEGQLVTHGSFGAGVVVRLEGHGDDLTVTVDFQTVGRKHILPRFAPLLPLD